MTDGAGIVTASAPVRIDFAGGWTDVPPFADREGGIVVNGALKLRVTATVEARADSLELVAEDLGERVEVRTRTDLVLDGRLDLLAAAVRRFGPATGRVGTRAETPAGSGLGSSGALGVALVAALARWTGEVLPPDELAERAYFVESEEARHPGGRQDQYAAALGGFHHLAFGNGQVEARQLRLEQEFQEELARRTVLCYTGTSRVSGATIGRVMAAYARGEESVCGALRQLRDVARAMTTALEAADLGEVGRLLTTNWEAQQRLDPAMRTEGMKRLEQVVSAHGMLGCKAAGAGAGGTMIFLAAGNPERLADAARAAGATILPAAWSEEGILFS